MKLPTYNSEVELRAQPTGPIASPEAFAAPYTAAARIGSQLADQGTLVLQRQAHLEAVADASKRLAQARLDMTQQLLDGQRTAPAGAAGFTRDYLQKFDDYSKETLENASGLARSYLARRIEGLRATLADQAMVFEAHSNVAKREQDLKDTVDIHANVVRSDDSQFEGALGDAIGAVHGSGLPADDIAKNEAHVKNLMATSLLQGLNDRNPQRALGLLNDGTYDSFLAPGVKNTLLEQNHRAMGEADATLRANVKSAYDNEVAAIRDRGYGVGSPFLSPATVQKAFPDQAGDFLKNLQDERDFYNARQSVALSSPQEDQALIAKYQPAAQPGGESDYALAASRRDALQKAIAAKWQMVTKDPVGYAVQASPALKSAFDAAQADPSKLNDALALSEQLQTKLGLPSYAHSVLSNGQAQDIVGKISTTPVAEAGQTMTGLATQYGDRWPRVFEDLVAAKLPGGYQVLGSVENPATRTNLSEALRTGASAMKDAAGPQAVAQVQKALGDALEPLVRTFANAPNAGTLQAMMHDNGELLALRYVTLGMTPNAAVTQTVRGLINDKYDIVQGYVPPGSTPGVGSFDYSSGPGTLGASYNARAPAGTGAMVQNHADRVFRSLQPSDVQYPPQGDGVPLTDEQRETTYFRDGIRNGAQWVTNPRDDGWLLLDQARQPVTRKDGSPVGFTFQEAGQAMQADRAAALKELSNVGVATDLQP